MELSNERPDLRCSIWFENRCLTAENVRTPEKPNRAPALEAGFAAAANQKTLLRRIGRGSARILSDAA